MEEYEAGRQISFFFFMAIDAKWKKLAQSLTKYERDVLPLLSEGKFVPIAELAKVTGLSELQVQRAVQWLENKSLAVHKELPFEVVSLEANGKRYQKESLPERRMLEVLDEKGIPLAKLAQKAGISSEEVNAALGLLRGRGAVALVKEKELRVKITERGVELRKAKFAEEVFFEKQDFPCKVQDVRPEYRKVVEDLRRRKNILRVERAVERSVALAPGAGDILQFVDADTIDAVSPQLLSSGGWKGKEFRRYDVSSGVPKVFGGKVQPYRAFLDSVRQKFVGLGFEEMTGPLVEQDFWNMDALYMPQFHSARDIHDAYYVREPKEAPLDPRLVRRVKDVHESGKGANSRGWGYVFDVKRTHRLLLRTQGTACSSRKLASPDLRIPGKYFGISRVFRHDVIDATHLPDFNQVEGIVVEEGLTFRHLIGLLRMFAKEFAGAEEVRLVPGYFPFTEPSVELYAKHPQLGWIELGGAGMFRPEVVMPLLGRAVPVCAWGLGIDRLGMFKLGFKDIRNLFSHDLQFLRDAKVV